MVLYLIRNSIFTNFKMFRSPVIQIIFFWFLLLFRNIVILYVAILFINTLNCNRHVVFTIIIIVAQLNTLNYANACHYLLLSTKLR